MTAKPRAGRRVNRTWLLAMAGLGGGLLISALSQRSLLTGTDATVFYPAVLLYNYAAITVATTILLLAGTMLALWVPQALGRKPGVGGKGIAAAVALAGSLLACSGSLPQLAVTYRHVDRAELAGRAYQLGVRFTANNDNAYILCGCDRLGLVCRCRALAEAGPPVFEERPRLVANAGDGSLTIVAGPKTVYHFTP